MSGFAGAYATGKLTIAVRHNWMQVPWAAAGTIIDAAVTEYAYDCAGNPART